MKLEISTTGSLEQNVKKIEKEIILSSKAKLDEIRTFYLQHETETTKKIIDVFEKIVQEWEVDGENATVLFGGSVGFGQTTNETKDIDFVYIGDNPAQFRKRIGSNEIIEIFKNEGILLEDLDYDEIDIQLVEAFLEKEKNGTDFPSELCENNSLEMFSYSFEKFLSHYWIGRPLDKRFEHLFNQALELEENDIVKQLKSTLGTSVNHLDQESFANSFVKYHERLQNRGISIPAEIIQLEKEII